MYRLPGTVNYGNFPKPNRNGSIFYSKPEFDFVANDVSYVSLANEACASLQIPQGMLDQQVEMFKNSVNRDPDVFKVPEDGGDAFFKKLNLGLFLKNMRPTDPIHTKAEAVIDFMQRGFDSLTTAVGVHAGTVTVLNRIQASPFGLNHVGRKTSAEAKNELRALPANRLHDAIIKIIDRYNRIGLRPLNNMGQDVDVLRLTFGLVDTGRWGYWGNGIARGDIAEINPSIWKGEDGHELDELKVFVYNMYPEYKNAMNLGLNQQARPEGQYLNASGVPTPNPTNIFLNIGERLRTDAFYRERNFKEVLQEVGVSVDEFERLVENAVSVIYWPDCIASKVSDQDLYNLVKGFGLPVDEMQGKSKAEICSFILTSLGFRPSHFTGAAPILNNILGTEAVQLLQQLVRAIRDPKLNAPAQGYLGFGAGNLTRPDAAYATGIEGAYLMTGFAAHNVTAEKAAKWLRATGVDASTQTGFLSYANNQNVFDTLDKRKDIKKIGFTGNMDYTKSMLDRKLVNNGAVGLWY